MADGHVANIDAEVERRVRLACRVLQVVRHDLGNFVYPSRELERSVGASGSQEASRYARQTRMLVSMVEEIREGIAVARWEPSPEEPALTEIGAWWRRFQSYGNAMLEGGGRCKLATEERVAVAAAPSRLSVLLLALLAWLDAHLGGAEFDATLRVIPEVETARLELEAELEDGVAGAIAAPALARRIAAELGGEIEARAEGSRPVFMVRLPAGSGVSGAD